MSYSPMVTVSQLCRYVKSLLEEQKNLTDLMVRGEISNLSFRSASGHLYFSLREGESLVRCVMFSRYSQKLRELPRDGAAVVVRGTVSLYERDGAFEILVYDLQELGQGKGRKTLEELRQQLVREGLFSPEGKRPLDPAPKTVGIITSPDGAALHDLVQTFALRNPLVRLIVYPAVVQGPQAPRSILAALRTLEREGRCQTVIIARGGGSAEDLSAFNDEELVRGVYACRVPVISAVGHEVDFTLLDEVADARAATPTAACVLAVPDLSVVRRRVDDYALRLERILLNRMGALEEKNLHLRRLLWAASPQTELKKNRQSLEYLLKSLIDAQNDKIRDLEGKLRHRITQLELLNPAALMLRGYSITMKDGRVVSSPGEVSVGDHLETILSHGRIQSVVTGLAEEEEKHE